MRTKSYGKQNKTDKKKWYKTKYMLKKRTVHVCNSLICIVWMDNWRTNRASQTCSQRHKAAAGVMVNSGFIHTARLQRKQSKKRGKSNGSVLEVGTNNGNWRSRESVCSGVQMRQNWREKFALLNSVELQFCFCIVRRGWVTSKMLPLTRSRLQQHCASHGFPTAVKHERTLESLFLFSSLAFLSFACFGVCTALWSRSTEAVVETVTLQSGKPWNKVDLGYVWSGRAWDAAGIYLFSINLFVIFPPWSREH